MARYQLHAVITLDFSCLWFCIFNESFAEFIFVANLQLFCGLNAVVCRLKNPKRLMIWFNFAPGCH